MADISKYKSPDGTTYNLKDTTARDTASKALPLSGGTMTGQIRTSFNQSVAVGSCEANAHTIPNLIALVRYSSGLMGSFQLTTAYGSIPNGWYNFIYIPHRIGGTNGKATGDNCNYGSLIITGMTVANQAWVIRQNNGNVSDCYSIRNTNTTYSLSLSGSTLTLTPSSGTAQTVELPASGGMTSVTAVLSASGWSGTAAPYTYDLSTLVSGITAESSVMIGYNGTAGTEDQLSAAQDAMIQGGEGTLIYAYGDKPEVDLPVVIQYS